MVRLTPLQITERWEQLTEWLKGLYPNAPDELAKVLQQVVAGFGQLWILQQGDKEVALSITSISFDALLGERTLLIYDLVALDYVTLHGYTEGLKQLKAFAKAKGCKQIVAYTEVDRLKRVALHLGGQNVNFVKIEVDR